MPHTEPPPNPPYASGANDEGPGAPALFPPVGNFNAVVPLSEIETDSESHVIASASASATGNPLVRGAAEVREHDEQEEATVVPARAYRIAQPFRPPSVRRLSWPAMITALALSLLAGLAAGVYLIKSVRPDEVQASASMTEGVAHEAAAETGDPQATLVTTESHPEARPQAEATPNTIASAVAAEVRAEKTNRDLPAPKRVTAVDAPPSRGGYMPESAPAKAVIDERTPEHPDRKASHLTSRMPSSPEAAKTRRATSVGASAPALRVVPERSLPVSSPPASAKSKRVIQWP